MREDLVEKFDAFEKLCNKDGLTEYHLKILDLAIKDDIFLKLEKMNDNLEKLGLEINDLKKEL